MMTNFPPLNKMNNLFRATVPLSLFAASILSATPVLSFQIPTNLPPPTVQNLPLEVPPTPGAPGPVGILGAITAFGYSRKLRSRIRDAK